MTIGADSVRIGIDIGGTFTDLVCLFGDGTVTTMKVPSTSDDYARAILDGLAALLDREALPASRVNEIIHGSTIASNAILERRGAKTGLITTRGFRDVLEIGRLRMPRLYDITWTKPPVLVERALRREVDERVSASGAVRRPLDEEGAAREIDHLVAEGIESLAVCLLNSYANPAHERTIQTIAHRRAPSLPVSISSDVLPEIREYERTSTTVINAYIMPVVQRYLGTLRRGLDDLGVRAPLLVMQSNGGLMGADRAAAKPMYIVESGPAAGVVGARVVTRGMDLDDVVTFDMGGTTAKAAIIEAGTVTRSAEYEVGGGIMVGARLLRGGGYLLRAPALDLAEVGAGGGSIVRVDAGGALRIGPQSAGAVPGPACYDRGGTDPTITDASVILGYLNPESLADGAVRLRPSRAHDAFHRVAAALAMDVVEAAYGAHQVAVSNMIRAIKAVSTERGRDPRRYALCAFGGNGPLFAAAMARTLSIGRVVVPPVPGVFSALGLLCSDVEHHFARTHLRRMRELDVRELREVLGAMEQDARAQLAAEGFSGDAVRLERWADLRYPGQTFELTVPLDTSDMGPDWAPAVEEAFAAEHERTYGHRASPGAPVDLVNVRLVARGVPAAPRVPSRIRLQRNRAGQRAGDRAAYFGRERGWMTTPVVDRAALEGGRAGPCIVEEYDATCVIPPGAHARLDPAGHIVIDMP